jgi:SAM-dependent methyltransferase
VTGSLAYRKNESAIMRGQVPEKYTRIVPFVPGKKILEIGSAEGVLALLLAKQGKEVVALERQPERHEAAQRLRDAWGMDVGGPRFICGDIRDNLCRLDAADTLVAVRMIYYLRDDLDKVFSEVAKKVQNVVLCGNRNRADRWRRGVPDEPDGPHNKYASREGMKDLLTRHGYKIVGGTDEGDEIVVGKKCFGSTLG